MGMDIISKYYDKQDGYHIGAEHDEFHMYAPENEISEEDVALLNGLGWHTVDEDGNWRAFV